MTGRDQADLETLAGVVRRFGLDALAPTLRACEALAGENPPLDVAVLGQFKAGKSSLLNAVLGEPVFPVGAVPVTTVVMRASAGPVLAAWVTYLDGSAEQIPTDRVVEFVTEARNPGNRRQVAVVDVFTPALRDWPGVRLVDTPGLGSVYAHNAKATRDWLPNAASVLVAVSAERPLSEEDRRLIEEARQTAPRVAVLLTKVDLLSDAERAEVIGFLEDRLRELFGGEVPVLPFSTRVNADEWVARLKDEVLRPTADDVNRERQRVLSHKLTGLALACRGYLAVALRAAERVEADRDQLRASVLDESVRADVLRDELALAEQRLQAAARPAFEGLLLAHHGPVRDRLREALAAELRTWTGNLARQSRRYEEWLRDRLTTELVTLSRTAAPKAAELLRQAEERFRRVVEAFRDRLNRNVTEAVGVSLSPVTWEARRPEVTVSPAAIGYTFDTQWDLLWWLLPMWLVGGLFRRHILRRVDWEVEKNLTRLAGDWSEAVVAAVADLRKQAQEWAEAELETLTRLLTERPTEAGALREYLSRLPDYDRQDGVNSPRGPV
jgi:GTP-binding protein EngB required for normal cell division